MERIAIVVVGPTCSGKTKLSLQIAGRIDSEIVSADSRQIYKYLNIGTAKPSFDELNLVKHHFIDILKPDEDYNVSRFEKESKVILENIFLKNKIPIIVGGSGLYVKSIIDGIVDIANPDPDLREQLILMQQKKGNDFMYNYLKSIDPDAAERMLPQNWKRVIRAIEVFKLTGQSILKFHEFQKKESQIKFLQYGLNWNRELLYKNIEQRVDSMISQGLVAETKKILSFGYSKDLNALNTVGYKEIINYLDNEISLEKAIELIKRNTRRYAKRQMTWFRKDKRIKWFNIDNSSVFQKIADEIILELKNEER